MKNYTSLRQPFLTTHGLKNAGEGKKEELKSENTTQFFNTESPKQAPIIIEVTHTNLCF